MEYTNTITITMENNETANTALSVIKKVLCTGDYTDGYSKNPAERLANDLQVKGAQIVQEEYNGYFTPEDISSVFIDVLKAIAELDSIHKFACDVYTFSTYAEDEIEATYENGLLKIKETYYPCGYTEYLPCPECGEDAVRLEDYDPSKEYVCPECGAIMNLEEQYKEHAPVVEETEYSIL